jgi:hypothetical protein
MEVWRAQQEGLDVISKSRSHYRTRISDQGSGELIKKVSGGLSYYTLGTTGFISVTDVVSISYELMNSTIKK